MSDAEEPPAGGSPAGASPRAELEIDEALVRELLGRQHGDLAGLDLQFLGRGWDNELYRLGESFVVRLPRRDVAAGLVRKECLWLPRLAAQLTLPVSAPHRIGLPTDIYPWWWSVNRFFDGADALVAPPADSEAAAGTLGRFVAEFRRRAPVAAPTNPYRGVPLAERMEAVDARIADLGERLDAVGGTAGVGERWRDLAQTPVWTGSPMWCHGDLHPGNLVVRDGELAAVIDFGDMAAGDPAVDLLVAWLMFDDADRAVFRAAADAHDEHLWRRGQAWGLAWSLAVLASSADRPDLAAAASRGLHSTLA